METPLSITIRPSYETNSFEVRFHGPGGDLIETLDREMLGLDPDDILLDLEPLLAREGRRKVTIGRCGCGYAGCGSIDVDVYRRDDTVVWSATGEADTFVFDGAQYETELRRAATDTAWETPERTAGRLVRERVDRRPLAARSMTFHWASGVCIPHLMTTSLWLEPGPYQVLVTCPWDSAGAEATADAMLAVLQEDPKTWTVRYYPQANGLGAPSIAGPNWNRG